jgi:ERCC4-type nuclease
MDAMSDSSGLPVHAYTAVSSMTENAIDVDCARSAMRCVAKGSIIVHTHTTTKTKTEHEEYNLKNVEGFAHVASAQLHKAFKSLGRHCQARRDQ